MSSTTKGAEAVEGNNKMLYLVLFVTDYRKEHDFRAHKTFSTKEAAMKEAKKLTTPLDEHEEAEEGPFEWEYSCPSSTILFADKMRVPNPGMSWTPVVVVVEVPFEG